MRIWVWALPSLNSKAMRRRARRSLTLTFSPSVSCSVVGGFRFVGADDVEKFLQVLRVETDLDFFAGVFGGDFFARFAFFGALRADFDFARADRQFDRARSFVSHQRDAANRGFHLFGVEGDDFVVVFRNDHLVVRERAGQFARDEQATVDFEIDVIRVFAEADFARRRRARF